MKKIRIKTGKRNTSVTRTQIRNAVKIVRDCTTSMKTTSKK